MSDAPIRLADVLEPRRGTSVFFETLPGGNNGDRLIEIGSRRTHRSYALRYVTAPGDADLILLRGNGAMLEHDRVVLDRLCRYARDYPTTTLCMEPSTFHYQRLQLRDVLPRRTAPIYLFARDRESYRYLESQRSPGSIEVGLDHDMALSLCGSTFISTLEHRTSDKVVVVERLDVEHPLLQIGLGALALSLYRSLVPKQIRSTTTPLVNRVRSTLPGAMRTDLFALAHRAFPEFAHLPRLYRDLGDVHTTTFDELLQIVSTCAAIVTTRLHPGILAAMLGKPTLLVVGAYGKIRWVYEYSLRTWPNVRLSEISDVAPRARTTRLV